MQTRYRAVHVYSSQGLTTLELTPHVASDPAHPLLPASVALSSSPLTPSTSLISGAQPSSTKDTPTLPTKQSDQNQQQSQQQLTTVNVPTSIAASTIAFIPTMTATTTATDTTRTDGETPSNHGSHRPPQSHAHTSVANDGQLEGLLVDHLVALHKAHMHASLTR